MWMNMVNLPWSFRLPLMTKKQEQNIITICQFRTGALAPHVTGEAKVSLPGCPRYFVHDPVMVETVS